MPVSRTTPRRTLCWTTSACLLAALPAAAQQVVTLPAEDRIARPPDFEEVLPPRHAPRANLGAVRRSSATVGLRRRGHHLYMLDRHAEQRLVAGPRRGVRPRVRAQGRRTRRVPRRARASRSCGTGVRWCRIPDGPPESAVPSSRRTAASSEPRADGLHPWRPEDRQRGRDRGPAGVPTRSLPCQARPMSTCPHQALKLSRSDRESVSGASEMTRPASSHAIERTVLEGRCGGKGHRSVTPRVGCPRCDEGTTSSLGRAGAKRTKAGSCRVGLSGTLSRFASGLQAGLPLGRCLPDGSVAFHGLLHVHGEDRKSRIRGSCAAPPAVNPYRSRSPARIEDGPSGAGTSG